MSTPCYVQHISGLGKQFEICPVENDRIWQTQNDDGTTYDLPKSEYRLCDPPVVWRDVSAECEVRLDALNRQQIWHKDICIDGATGYQFMKIEIHNPDREPTRLAFLIERREP